jgi:myosin-crossreactive antigen
VENGMFAEHWDELNTLQMMQQMGALPHWDSAAEVRRD